MSSYVKSGLCLALAALQVSPDSSQHNSLRVGSEVVQHEEQKSVLDVPATTSDVTPKDSENVVPRYSRAEVADHCHSDSCWIVVNNRVYDVTRFLREHPGGDDVIMEYAGFDATTAFIDKGHSRDAYEMLAEFLIGEVTKDDWFLEKNCT